MSLTPNNIPNPSYEAVCTYDTGYVEVAHI